MMRTAVGTAFLLLLSCVLAAQANILGQLAPPRKGCGGDRNAPPLCCQHRNVTCLAYGLRMNAEQSNVCFCDNACMLIGDCCVDYQDVCHPVDCMLEEEWGPFGQCGSKCGWGIMKRSKRVRVHPRNGGQQCATQTQKLACYGYNCKVPRAHTGGLDELRETAKIIPAKYGSWRINKMYNPYNDIRKNLFNHYNGDKAKSERPTYCAKYEVVNTRQACNSTFFSSWSPDLSNGATLCVECQSLAMRQKLGLRCKGHGVFQKQTRWNAATVPGCHGEWVMKTRHEDCKCDPNDKLSFILI